MPSHEVILRHGGAASQRPVRESDRRVPLPAIPEPVGWAFDPAPPPGSTVSASRMVRSAVTKGGSPPPATPFPREASSAGGFLELSFTTTDTPWQGDLGAFLRDKVQEGAKHVRVHVVGSGSHFFTPVRLPRGLWLEVLIDAYSAAEPPSWSPRPEASGPALIELEGGVLVLANLVIHQNDRAHIDTLIRVEDTHLVLSHCQLTAPSASGDFAGDLIEFRAATTRRFPSDSLRPLFSTPVDRPVCRLVDSLLITGGTAAQGRAGPGARRAFAVRHRGGAHRSRARPVQGGAARFEADLSLDRCTITSERAIIRLGAWPGLAPGPDRPWLIGSRHCALIGMYDRKERETVLLRADADALARGTLLWQAAGDAADVDHFIAAAAGQATANRTRDLQSQWVNFWGSSHMNGLTGPRSAGGPLAVRFREKLRPGRVEPDDLILVGSEYRASHAQLEVGADLTRQGITPPLARRSRN